MNLVLEAFKWDFLSFAYILYLYSAHDHTQLDSQWHENAWVVYFICLPTMFVEAEIQTNE